MSDTPNYDAVLWQKIEQDIKQTNQQQEKDLKGTDLVREDQKRIARITDHMNADHKDTLVLFLRVYCLVSRSTAKSAKMEDVSLNEMIISADRTRYRIPFEPPLSSLDVARQKVVEMHNHCLKTLGFSDIVVKSYSPPSDNWFHTIMFTVCLTTFISFSWRGNFQPGSIPYALIFQHVPSFATFCFRIQPLLISLMGGIHLAEAIHLAIYRLRPHRVPTFSRLWWAWIVDDFIEGITALKRFDAIVREEKIKKQQHKPNAKKEK